MNDQDSETIRTFQWVGDDTPLPINPDDPDEVSAALRWATSEYHRLDAVCLRALNGTGWRPGDAEMLYHDRDALGRFKAACMRTLHAARQRDRAILAAWVAGEPIRDDISGTEVVR